MTVLKKTIFMVAVALVLLVVGCGGSDGGGDTQSSTISKAQFIKRANAICKETKRELIDEALRPLDALPEGSPARRKLEFKLVTTVVAQKFEDEITAIEELGAPPGDEAKIKRILAAIEPAVEEARTEPETYVAGKDYRGGKEHYGEAYRLAVDYGMKWCPFR